MMAMNLSLMRVRVFQFSFVMALVSPWVLLPGGGALACTVLFAGRSATQDGSVMASHSDDGEGDSDPRVVRVDAKKFPSKTSYPRRNPNSQQNLRNIRPDVETFPRFVGSGYGETYEPTQPWNAKYKPTTPVGSIEQVESTYAYYDANYGIMNEKQLGMGESTCSARIAVPAPWRPGGEAMFCINELSRIAMERCDTARCAVQLMGQLAEDHGYYGASAGIEGSGESLVVHDKNEGWVFHILPSDPNRTKTSANWVAQRIPDDHVLVVANMYVIRHVDFTDTANFLFSKNLVVDAIAGGWYTPKTPGDYSDFDFTAAYSDGEYNHKFYTGRRVWGAYRLLASHLNLPADYHNLRDDAPYPFSARPDRKVTAQDFFRVHRDWYENTPFDMSKHLAAGAFGVPDRYMTEGTTGVKGAWERSIALFRTAYSHITVSRSWLPDSVGGVVWLGQGAAHGTSYVPLFAGANRISWAHSIGDPSSLNRTSVWWSHRYALNVARGMRFMDSHKFIAATQSKLESDAADLVSRVSTSGDPPTGDSLAQLSEDHVNRVRDAWWSLVDTVVVTFADGWHTTTSQVGAALGYPSWWLETVGYENGPPPPHPHDNKEEEISVS